MAKKQKQNEFPKSAFLLWQGDGTERYLIAADNAQEHAETGEVRFVGEYQLVRVLKVTSEVVIKVT